MRVRVYAGVDPVTGQRHDLVAIIPPGPDAERGAKRTLDQFDGAPNTLTIYRSYMRNHVSPFIGHVKVGALNAGRTEGDRGRLDAAGAMTRSAHANAVAEFDPRRQVVAIGDPDEFSLNVVLLTTCSAHRAVYTVLR